MRKRRRISRSVAGGVVRPLGIGVLLLAGLAAGPAAAEPGGQPDGLVGALFADPTARVVGTLPPPSEEGPGLETEGCQARLLLDCFVMGTVQTLSRLPGSAVEDAGEPVAEPEPAARPVAPRVPSVSIDPVAPPAAAPEPPPELSTAESPTTQPPGPPPELVELQEAIGAAGLDDLVSIGGDAGAGVLTIRLPE